MSEVIGFVIATLFNMAIMHWMRKIAYERGYREALGDVLQESRKRHKNGERPIAYTIVDVLLERFEERS